MNQQKLNALAIFGALLAPVSLSRVSVAATQGGPHPPAVDDSDFFDNGPNAAAKIELGRMLFFDKILSGNQNISCATCHHSLTGTGDGLSLPIGEGARGLGVTRGTGSGADAVHERVPRNAPQVFNLGALEFTVMFHDGRVQADASQPSGFLSPAGANLPMGLDNTLAAQAMFPVTSGTEMAGQLGENAQANAAAAGNLAGPGGVLEILAQKLQAIPEYVTLFQAAYPSIVNPSDITYVHAANAIAAFEGGQWRFTNSPYDRYLAHDNQAMSTLEKRGMQLFNGKAGCADCHSGPFQSDQSFHAIAMPQIGAGKGDNLPGYSDGHDDFGLERVTGNPADRFRFRTPTLRNIALSAPYGHTGAYDTLEAVVRHHLDPVASLNNYDQSQATLPPRADLDAADFIVMNDPARVAAIAAANELAPVSLKDSEVDALVAFLHALTDPAALDMRRDVPMAVPSGLPLAE
jgi:cytochrome c peroxidase